MQIDVSGKCSSGGHLVVEDVDYVRKEDFWDWEEALLLGTEQFDHISQKASIEVIMM